MKRLSFLLLSMGLVSCQASTSSAPPASPFATGQITLVSPDNQATVLNVEFARTPAEQQQGLMERTSLAENAGMVFAFTPVQPVNFWMKNTRIPLDVLFFSEDDYFLSVSTMSPCVADPCPLYPSNAPVKNAVEVPAGFAARHGIGPGWRIALLKQ